MDVDQAWDYIETGDIGDATGLGGRNPGSDFRDLARTDRDVG
jgi:hypothetical protein